MQHKYIYFMLQRSRNLHFHQQRILYNAIERFEYSTHIQYNRRLTLENKYSTYRNLCLCLRCCEFMIREFMQIYILSSYRFKKKHFLVTKLFIYCFFYSFYKFAISRYLRVFNEYFSLPNFINN